MPNLNLALDKSLRTVDADGRLHVSRTHISKANICPYMGNEIPGWDTLGLESDKIYNLYRDPAELAKGASTFALNQLLQKHIPVNAEDTQKQDVVGTIGSNVEFNDPYLDADICVWDAKAIAAIESGQIEELSCGYRYTPVMEPGEVEGEKYDGRMTDIIGNHLALVERGRAGSDVVVADHDPFFNKESAMKMSKLGLALFNALSAMSPKIAADSAIPAMLEKATKKGLNKKALKAAVIAADDMMKPEMVDNVVDSIMDVESQPTAQEPMATTPADKIQAMLAGLVDPMIIEQIVAMCSPAAGMDAEKDDDDKKVDKEEMKAAMDSMRADFKAAQTAIVDVRSVVGDVIGMDSAEDIYMFALDHLKVDHEGVEGVKSLKALFKVASKAPVEVKPINIASDSASMATMFPQAMRIKVK